MKKTIFLFVALSTIFFACTEKKSEQTKNDSQEKVATTNLKIENFATQAGKYVGKQISVTGLVTHICEHGGKKIHLTGTNGQEISIQSNGERFANELMGSKVTVTGIVKEFRMDEPYLKNWEAESMTKHQEDGDDDNFNATAEQIKIYRDSIAKLPTDYIPLYSLDYESYEEIK